MRLPRFILAAPKSGSGKTLLTCSLLSLFREDGDQPCAFKCGPDYIDPMFHRTVIGIPSFNLDTFFSGRDEIRRLLGEAPSGCRIAVMEGVMGLYDGLGGIRREGSAYDLAVETGTPVVLVLDVRGMGRTMIPVIRGLLSYDKNSRIRGVILNRTSESFFRTIAPEIEKEAGIPVIGYVPSLRDVKLESRHLGLILPHEVKGLQDMLRETSDTLRKTLDIEKLRAIADEAEELPGPSGQDDGRKSGDGTGPESVTASAAAVQEEGTVPIAVARDEAFCFYYEENIRLLRSLGARIIEFSPVHDGKFPEEACGVLLGGGYPELAAEELSRNTPMRESLLKALKDGLPVLAECGGFMYLHEVMKDAGGKASYPEVGFIPASCENTGHLRHFGYVEIKEKTPLFLQAGETIRGHEFHYYDSTDNGSDCTAVKPVSGKSWDCVHENSRMFVGFPHLYYPSNPHFAQSFVRMCRSFAGERKRKDR